MIRLLIGFLVFYPLWLVAASFLQRRVLFPRQMTEPVEGADGFPGLEKVWLDTDQGKVETWFVPGKGVDAQHPGPMVFFAHGNGELIDYWPLVIQQYQKMGVSTALVEYRGYGRSAGSPSQAAITEDYVKAYERLSQRLEVDRSRIVYHGRSVGSGIVSALAAEHPPAAMILQSPFTAVSDIMLHYGIPPFLCLDPFDNKPVVRSLDRPILLMHGRQDTIIPISHSRKLLKLARNGRLIEYDCGHNDFPMETKRYWSDIEAFLQENKILN